MLLCARGVVGKSVVTPDDLAIPAAMELPELMRRYCDGDADAFRTLLAPRILLYLVELTGCQVLAGALLQKTFLVVHRSRGAYIRGADPVPWIRCIARREVLDDAKLRERVESGARATAA